MQAFETNSNIEASLIQAESSVTCLKHLPLILARPSFTTRVHTLVGRRPPFTPRSDDRLVFFIFFVDFFQNNENNYLLYLIDNWFWQGLQRLIFHEFSPVFNKKNTLFFSRISTETLPNWILKRLPLPIPILITPLHHQMLLQ